MAPPPHRAHLVLQVDVTGPAVKLLLQAAHHCVVARHSVNARGLQPSRLHDATACGHNQGDVLGKQRGGVSGRVSVAFSTSGPGKVGRPAGVRGSGLCLSAAAPSLGFPSCVWKMRGTAVSKVPCSSVSPFPCPLCSVAQTHLVLCGWLALLQADPKCPGGYLLILLDDVDTPGTFGGGTTVICGGGAENARMN